MSQGENYLSVMRANLVKLRAALGCTWDHGVLACTCWLYSALAVVVGVGLLAAFFVWREETASAYTLRM